MPPSPSSPSHLHLPHLSSSSSVIFLICHLHLLHTSRLMPHASITLSYTKPPSLPLTHTSLHQSTSTTNLHTLASTRRPPWLLHTSASTSTPYTPQPTHIHCHASQPPLQTNLPLLPPPHADLPMPSSSRELIFSFSR